MGCKFVVKNATAYCKLAFFCRALSDEVVSAVVEPARVCQRFPGSHKVCLGKQVGCRLSLGVCLCSRRRRDTVVPEKALQLFSRVCNVCTSTSGCQAAKFAGELLLESIFVSLHAL